MGSQKETTQEPKIQSLALQGSPLYNLTLDDVQNQLGNSGKPLGSMNLEDFLEKAGLVASSDSSSSVAFSQQNISQHSNWMQYQQLPSVHNVHQHQHQNHHDMALPVVANPVLDSETMVTSMSPSSLMGTLSDTQSPGRKRVASGNAVERTVERRQKRMIKNRESAARSRARKQAYTHELEIKVSNLEEENERLRRQNETERVLPRAPPPEPKHQLRRTSSSLF